MKEGNLDIGMGSALYVFSYRMVVPFRGIGSGRQFRHCCESLLEANPSSQSENYLCGKSSNIREKLWTPNHQSYGDWHSPRRGFSHALQKGFERS